MSARERVRRPEPERTEPIRRWETLFGAANARPAGRASAATPEPTAPPRGAADPTDPISAGVQAGYRVIDDYIRQGQNAARVVWGPAAGGVPFTGGEDVQQRLGTMMRTATDFANVWLEFVSGAGGRSPWGAPSAWSMGRTAPPGSVEIHPFSIGKAEPRATAAPSGDGRSGDGRQPTDGASFSIDIRSRRRTEAILDLRPSGSGDAFRVHDLRSVEPKAPRLPGATIERIAGEERVRVRLVIPDEQPPGLYSGLVLDEATSLPRGMLSVRVFADGEP